MRAYGSDRVRPGKGEQWILFSRRSKGWVPRVAKTLTRTEHPGTAVACEERIFEVVLAHAEGVGVRYVLEPWRDEHIIRVSDEYSEASEIHREAEYRAAAAREKGRKAANFFGIFTGHLPAVVQEQLSRELGISPARLTLLSLLIPFAYLLWFANEFARRVMNPNAGTMPVWLIALAFYLGIETAIRFMIVWLQNRPVGSAAGGIVYLLFYVLGGKRANAVSPFAVERGYNLYVSTPADEVALRDAIAMREPLLTLLSPQEQASLAERFGYNYRAQAFKVAFIILFFAVAGVATSLAKLRHGPSVGAVASLLAAAFVAVEQVVRLSALRRGPAGSVMAVLVRPFTRKLLR